MNYIALIAMAAIAAVAVWRVLSLSKSHAAVTAENTALKLDLEKARNADAVELATTRQALESLRAARPRPRKPMRDGSTYWPPSCNNDWSR